MANSDYRELQLSSSQLVLIFVAIIIVGVIIFLLGVSVGKKQAQIAETTQIAEEPITERVEEEKPRPVEEPAEKPKPAEEKKTAITRPRRERIDQTAHYKVQENQCNADQHRQALHPLQSVQPLTHLLFFSPIDPTEDIALSYTEAAPSRLCSSSLRDGSSSAARSRSRLALSYSPLLP